jgi:hypothetical protein
MDKFLTWALIILVAIIVLFSSFSISLDNSSSSTNKKLGLMNNSINNSTGDGGILNSIYSRKPTEKAGLGTPVGAKFYAPKCG